MSAVQPGDVEINSCSLATQGGTIDLSQDFISAVVYESILVPNCIGEITVLDSTDAIGKLQVTGGEVLTFSFQPPGVTTVTYTLTVDKVSQEAFPGSEKTKQYTLHAVGQETFQAKTNYIQKAYKTDIASIVQDIHTTFLKSISPLITEATQGIQKIIIPNMKPFEAIDMIRRRAVSTQNMTSTFLYFQNALGHNFKTIEGMMQDGVVKNFIHSDTIGHSIYTDAYNNIIDYEVPQIMSATSRVDLGGLVQRTATFDMRTRKYETKDQTINGAGGFVPNAGTFNNALFKEVFGQVFGLFAHIPFDSAGRPNTSIPQASPLQLAYVSNLMQNYIILKVFGDTRVKAGDMINAAIPESVASADRGLDPLVSGKYLVSRIARHIGMKGQMPRYTDSIEGISGSFPGS